MYIDCFMKIGILTYHCVPNFGAQLQAISTVGFLKRMGHEPIVLHWYPMELEQLYEGRIPQEQLHCHEVFTSDVLPVSRLCRTEDELVKEIERLHLDGMVVGSDALFKYTPSSVRNHPLRKLYRKIRGVQPHWDLMEGNPFFGHFAEKLTKKIPLCAFSVSSQNAPYRAMNGAETAYMKRGMDNFSFISVRDEWTKQMVEYVTHKSDVSITPDPVFSFNQNYYGVLPTKEEILQKFSLPDNYVLLSFSKHYMKADYIRQLADELLNNHLQPVAFPMPEVLQRFGLNKYIPLPLNPLDWYALIKYSKGYIGERMHPIVVSLHNAVPFFCFDEYGTYSSLIDRILGRHILSSSKTYLILKRAGLTDCMYSYHSQLPFPEVSTVVNGIKSFDCRKCSDFSKEMQVLYTKSMEMTLSEIETGSCMSTHNHLPL